MRSWCRTPGTWTTRSPAACRRSHRWLCTCMTSLGYAPGPSGIPPVTRFNVPRPWTWPGVIYGLAQLAWRPWCTGFLKSAWVAC
jgi:hypothetical protein